MADLDDDSEGLRVVLTPIQFVALLQQASIDRPSTLGNRFWGALSVIGGAAEMVASVPLWFAPEPTSKIAAGVLDAMGADVTWTGMRQVWTGRRTVTVTAEVLDRSLRALGVDPEIADRLAAGTDQAVNLSALVATPIAVARSANAVRVLSIRRGLIDLEVEETFPGAHTIARHVGRTEAQLRERLAAEKNISAASSFRTLEDAERGVSEVITVRAAEIERWAANAVTGATRRFTLDATSAQGIVLLRDGSLFESRDVAVVLKKIVQDDRVYYVLTAFVR